MLVQGRVEEEEEEKREVGDNAAELGGERERVEKKEREMEGR